MTEASGQVSLRVGNPRDMEVREVWIKEGQRDAAVAESTIIRLHHESDTLKSV